jgi:hypothetical protein
MTSAANSGSSTSGGRVGGIVATLVAQYRSCKTAPSLRSMIRGELHEEESSEATAHHEHV